MKGKKHMKTIMKFIYAIFAVAILAIGALPAIAAPGDLFQSEEGTNIYKFAPDGTQSTFATGLNRSYGLAFDSVGNLFAADFDSGTIYKFTPDGTRSTFATGLNSPAGLAFDSAGNLFVGDLNGSGGTIYKFTPAGTQSIFASDVYSFGLAFDSAGNLFAADFSSSTIYKFAPDGTQSTFATGLSNPVGLAFDSAGNLFEADFSSFTINKFTPDGTRSTFATTLINPLSLAIQPAPAVSYAAQVQPPINADGTSIFTTRRGVVPVKFTLTHGGVATCDLPPATIAVIRTGGGVIGEVNESLYNMSADSGSNFRIDNCQYVYNLNSRALGVGIYRVDILINGQVVSSATFELR